LVGAEFVLRHNEVGSWKVNLHATSDMAEREGGKEGGVE